MILRFQRICRRAQVSKKLCHKMASASEEEDSDLLGASDLEAQQASAPKTCFGYAFIVGLVSMAFLAAALLLMDWVSDQQKGKAHWRMLQAASGGSAIGSCWLKCGATMSKGIHAMGAFISRIFESIGHCIHSVFSAVNEGFGSCCGTVGEQLNKCPACGHWCSHCWNASGRCVGGCCDAVGNLINSMFTICGSSFSGCCDAFSNCFSTSWTSCGNFLNDTCPF